MQLKITGTATLGDIRSKCKIVDEEMQRICEIPLEIIAEDNDGAILDALYVGELFDALWDQRGEIRMPHFSAQAIDYPLRNVRLDVATKGNTGALTIEALDLRKLKWRCEPGWKLCITAKARAAVTLDQWSMLWQLQPYAHLSITLTDNQSALSLEAA